MVSAPSIVSFQKDTIVHQTPPNSPPFAFDFYHKTALRGELSERKKGAFLPRFCPRATWISPVSLIEGGGTTPRVIPIFLSPSSRLPSRVIPIFLSLPSRLPSRVFPTSPFRVIPIFLSPSFRFSSPCHPEAIARDPPAPVPCPLANHAKRHSLFAGIKKCARGALLRRPARSGNILS